MPGFGSEQSWQGGEEVQEVHGESGNGVGAGRGAMPMLELGS